ncbi:hypothetical protein L1887_08120 [Cichorium endivia]|nr:hypothetical protein L1887_08120 [Cichorium endivia]
MFCSSHCAKSNCECACPVDYYEIHVPSQIHLTVKSRSILMQNKNDPKVTASSLKRSEARGEIVIQYSRYLKPPLVVASNPS